MKNRNCRNQSGFLHVKRRRYVQTFKNECFCERPYDSAEIQILLERAGMELVTIYDDMTFSPASPENERWVVVAKKMRKETDRRGA